MHDPARRARALAELQGERVALIDAMNAGDVDVLIVHGANPMHSLPAASGFADGARAR